MTLLNKDKILETAKDLVAEGKFDRAIKEYEKILEADPKEMRVRLRIAELYVKRRQIAEAIKTYRLVAESYTNDGFFLKAVTVYKNVLRLNPSLMDVNLALSGLYEKMGLSKDAIHQYEILAQTYEQKNQYAEALKIREKLVELATDNPNHRIRLAEAYQRDERKEEAIEQYEILAKQYRARQEDPKKLIELYERILPHRPANKGMLSELVRLYYDKKEFKPAIKWLESRKQIVAGDPLLMELAGQMYASLNQLESARSKFQDLAEHYLAQGKTEEALKAYEDILVILPEEAETVRRLAEEAESGSFEAMLQRANNRRGQRDEEIRAKEEAIEQEKEAKEKERKAQKSGKPAAPAPAVSQPAAPAVKPAAKPAAPSAAKKTVTPLPPPPPKPVPSLSDKEIAFLLKTGQSALSLGKAYQATGLKDEAKQELNQAREALQKILKANPDHKEALELFKQLPK